MISRRFLLGAGVTAALAPLVGCSLGGPGGVPGVCPSAEALTSFGTLSDAPLSYEVSGERRSFEADPQFIDLLQQWTEEWVAVAGLGPLTEVSTYGAHVDKCPSWHAAGRAFDIAELVHRDGGVSCRYDVWGEDGGRLRQYWRLAASLSTRFTYTLAYPFNAQHHNHLHVDNGVNGYEPTRFKESSKAQTQIVQGVLRHVVGSDVEITGDFDVRTRDAVRSFQRSEGIRAKLSSTDGWREFLTAAVGL